MKFSTSLVLAVCSALPSICLGETVFFDDFIDGQPAVNWVSNGTLTFENDSMRVQGTGGIWADVNGLNLTDTSIRVRAKFVEGEYIALAAREPSDGSINYFGGLDTSTNEAGIGIGGSTLLASAPFDFDMTQSDVMMQLDVIGNEISFWAWTPDQPMPAAPLVSVTDETLVSGDIFVSVHSGPGGGPAEAEFRFVHVATSSIPEPSSFLLIVTSLIGLCGLRKRY